MSEEIVVTHIEEFVDSLIELSGFELSANIQHREDSILVELSGEDVPLALGRNGELLNAFEYLANKICVKSSTEARIIFDAAGYRGKRERELQLMAEHAAERVRSSKRPFTFEPMSPGERRIVHLTLSQQTGVRTESQGEGEDRKVTVYPE